MGSQEVLVADLLVAQIAVVLAGGGGISPFETRFVLE
jgi:hypothetical protein